VNDETRVIGDDGEKAVRSACLHAGAAVDDGAGAGDEFERGAQVTNIPPQLEAIKAQQAISPRGG
jgi:hypothetical protein